MPCFALLLLALSLPGRAGQDNAGPGSETSSADPAAQGATAPAAQSPTPLVAVSPAPAPLPSEPLPSEPLPSAHRIGTDRLALIDQTYQYATYSPSSGMSGSVRVKGWGVAKVGSPGLNAFDFATLVGDTETVDAIERRGRDRRIAMLVLTGVSALCAVPLAATAARGDLDNVSAGTFVAGFTGAGMLLVFPFAAASAPRRVRRTVLPEEYNLAEAQAWMAYYNDGGPRPEHIEEE